MKSASPETSFPTLLQEFFLERLIQQRNVSTQTVAAYRDCFRLLLQFAQRHLKKAPEHFAITDLDAPLIMAFLNHLETERHNTIRSRNARLAAIRSFLHFVAGKEPTALPVVQRALAVPMKRCDKPVLGFLSRAEMQALLDAPDCTTWCGQRDQVMFTTLYNTGGRVSEITGLRVSDVILEGTAAVRIHGKGRKERTVPLWRTTAGAIRKWLKRTDGKPDQPLFSAWSGARLTRSAVTARLQLAVQRAAKDSPQLGKRRISPHTFRHYLPFRTMSSSRRALTKLGRNTSRDAQLPGRSPDIVGCRLQTVQEREESVARFVPAGFCVRRGCPCKRFFLHGKCCLEINLCGLDTFVAEPQRDHRAVNSIFEKVHGHGVPQAVDGDPFLLQRGADHGSHPAMLVQQVLYTVDAEAFPLSVWEQHASVTSLALAQPGFQHGDYRSGDGCTAFLAPFADHSHVGAGAEDDVFAL